MKIEELRLTQFFEPGKGSLRSALPTYDLSLSSILDPVASAIIILFFTALVGQSIAFVWGLSTHGILMKSMYEGMFPVSLLSSTTVQSKSRAPFKVRSVTLKLLLVVLLLFSLGLEALLFYAVSSTTISYSLEKLGVRRLKSDLYHGENRFAKLPTTCVEMVHARESLVYTPITICALQSSAAMSFSTYPNEISIIFGMTAHIPELSILRDGQLHTLQISTVLQASESFEVGLIRLNGLTIFPKRNETALWLAQRAMTLFNCSKDLTHLSVENVSSYHLTNCVESRDVEETLYALFLSTLELDSRTYTSKDFRYIFSDSSTPIDDILNTYARYTKQRIPGSALWITAIVLVLLHVVVSICSEDLNFAKDTAIAEFLGLTSTPIESGNQVPINM